MTKKVVCPSCEGSPVDDAGNICSTCDGACMVDEVQPTSNDLIEALREACQQCPCTVRERDSGHRIDCGVPRWQEVLERYSVHEPPPALDRVQDIIEGMHCECDVSVGLTCHPCRAIKVIAEARRATQPPCAVPPLDDDVRWILGRPNFACAGIAAGLRLGGHVIECKAEQEQAAVIHWMLTLYVQHGADWRGKAESALHTMRSAPTKCAVPPAGWACTREAGHEGPCAAVPKQHPDTCDHPSVVNGRCGKCGTPYFGARK